MKLFKAGLARKVRYGGVTAVLTAAIIAIVIIINVIFTALAHKKLWYTDLTPDVEFTLTDTCISYMKNGDPTFTESTSPIAKINDFREELRTKNNELPEDQRLSEEQIKEKTQIEIIFCDEELSWCTDDMARKYVWKTAADLALEFPDHIKLTYVNIYRNPTAVSKYEGVSSASDIIIKCGTEYRVRSLKNFYYMDGETVVAYNGEKVFVSAFMALTRSKSPVVCFTTGHGEETSANLSVAFVTLLENAGYEPKWIDLTKEEIPADCRLMVIFEPTGDFVTADGLSAAANDEIRKLDEYLANDNSLMVFMSATLTSPLNNLEEYLEEWGISFDRQQEGGIYHPQRVQDISQSFDEYGFNVKGDYVTYGLGNDITSAVREDGKTMIFPNAMPISYSGNVTNSGYRDTEDGPVLGNYGVLSDDGQYRQIFDMFVSSKNAKTIANGVEVESANKGNLFKLMTISVQDRLVQEDNYGITTIDKASYVIACGCPQFASEAALTGSYGNSDFLNYTLRKIGHEPVPVGLEFRWFGDYTIDTIETKAIRTYTLVLTLVPAIISLGAGIVVLVRRKNR